MPARDRDRFLLVLAGGGFLACAAIAAGFSLFVNLPLRPIVMFIDRHPWVASEVEVGYLGDLPQPR